MKKTFKLNDTLFQINGHWYLVDKEAKIESGEWYIYNNDFYLLRPNESLGLNCYKIIASTNKTLEGIHYFSIEEDCEHDFVYKILFDHTGVDVCTKCGKIKPQIAKQYSEDALKKAIGMARSICFDGWGDVDYNYSNKQIIQSLQPQIESIEVEYEPLYINALKKNVWIPKLNSKGELQVTAHHKDN